MEIIVILLLILVLIFYTEVSWSFVALKFYGWFILPIFPSLPTLTWYEMVGVVTFIGLIKYRSTNNKQKFDKESILENIYSIIFTPWLYLLYGYVVYYIVS